MREREEGKVEKIGVSGGIVGFVALVWFWIQNVGSFSQVR